VTTMTTKFRDVEIRAPRGTQLNAKSWLTEAPLRMLMNNLDPDVAENPKELVVYGGIGRAEPELLIRIEAEIFGDLDDLAELEFARQSFLAPAVDGQVPPHRPLPDWKTINRLKIHYGAESFNVIHYSSTA